MRNVVKKLLRGCNVGLFATLLTFFSGIEGRGMSSGLTSALSQAQSTTPARPVSGGVSITNTSEYTQTEAHLQLNDVKKEMAKFAMRVPEDKAKPDRELTSNQMVTPYLNIVAEVINKEVAFKNSHYAFYHVADTIWRVPQDLYKKLYIHYKKPGSQLNDFAFMRFTNAKSLNAQDFLRENIAEWGGVNDNKNKHILLSVNIDLFGNVGFPGECTWNYFLEPKSHFSPFPQQYNDILSSFGLTYDIELLAKEAGTLGITLLDASPEQALFQFFIPKNIADNVAYVAWVLGFPAHPKSMSLMEELLEGKPRVGKFSSSAVRNVMKKFKREEDNPVYQELTQAAANGDFGVSGYLEAFCTNPFASNFKNVNETQARLLITNDVFKNPASGVKIFTYFTTPQNVQEQYTKKLDALVNKIIAAENAKSPEKKATDKAKNDATAARLIKELEDQKAAEKATKKPKK